MISLADIRLWIEEPYDLDTQEFVFTLTGADGVRWKGTIPIDLPDVGDLSSNAGGRQLACYLLYTQLEAIASVLRSHFEALLVIVTGEDGESVALPEVSEIEAAFGPGEPERGPADFILAMKPEGGR